MLLKWLRLTQAPKENPGCDNNRGYYFPPRSPKSFLQRSQGKSARHGRQFFSASQTVGAEFSFEDSSDGRDEGGTARQEDAIDVTGLDMTSLKQSLDAVFDSADRRLNPGLEIEPANFLPDLDRRVFEEKETHPMVREFHFGPLGRPVEFVSEMPPLTISFERFSDGVRPSHDQGSPVGAPFIGAEIQYRSEGR